MKKDFEHIDQIFRDRLTDYSEAPPERVWNNIHQALNEPPKSGGFSGKPMILYSSAAAGLIVMLSLAWFLWNPKPGTHSYITESQSINTPVQNPHPSHDAAIATPLVNTTDPLTHETTSSTANAVNEEPNINTPTHKQPQANATQKGASAGLNTPTTAKLLPQSSVSRQIAASNTAATEKLNPAATVSASAQQLFTTPLTALSAKPNTEMAAPDYRREEHPANDYRHTRKLSGMTLGISAAPEWIYYSADTLPVFRNNTFSADLLLHFDEFFLQTGLGLSRSQDYGRYKVDYKSYEYMGSYTHVDSLTFDVNGNEVKPIYHTSQMDVYDSISRQSLENSDNLYTFLQIPVLFGYQHQSKRWSYFVKGGPLLSLMIYQKEAEIVLEGNHINITELQNSMPTRLKTNWQFRLSTGVSYRMGNRTHLVAEPTLSYYFTPAHEQGITKTKHPYSLGIRAGLQFDL